MILSLSKLKECKIVFTFEHDAYFRAVPHPEGMAYDFERK